MDWMCFYMCETVHVEIVRNGKVIISRKRITGMCYYITKYKGQYKTTELHFTRGRGWACVLLWDVSKLYNYRFWISLWNPAIYYCHRFCFCVMAINAMSSCLCFVSVLPLCPPHVVIGLLPSCVHLYCVHLCTPVLWFSDLACVLNFDYGLPLFNIACQFFDPCYRYLFWFLCGSPK